ncbi:Lrp/AsnC ligand binding domain-containing protein [Candidatus Marsarchaeota archaeon]|jgi:hypothetical protein|nr:Lrp/AsnC ligand binding domain-containing protein [Candidatus Marsarchaeota archaeon]
MKGDKKNRMYRLRTKDDFLHSFFFIKPQKGTDINELADALLGIDEVQEVCVTEGDIGYMVKAKFDEKTYEKVEKSIAEVAGPRYGRFVSAMELKKAIK